jgi:hypothetical protein
MIIGIILIVLILLGVRLIRHEIYDTQGILMCYVFSLLLLIHIFIIAISPYEYGLFVEKRNAFEKTLKNARENGNQYETAAITKEVVKWNQELAQRKYDNKTIFFDQYIDDRIELLEPIK